MMVSPFPAIGASPARHRAKLGIESATSSPHSLLESPCSGEGEVHDQLVDSDMSIGIDPTIEDLAEYLEPGDAPLQWHGSPPSARSQGSWDPDCETWKSKGKVVCKKPLPPNSCEDEEYGVLVNESFEFDLDTTNSVGYRLRPGVVPVNPLAIKQPSSFANPLAVKQLDLTVGGNLLVPSTSSSIRKMEPPPAPPPSQRIWRKKVSQSARDAWTLSEEEALDAESDSSSFYSPPLQKVCELPHESPHIRTRFVGEADPRHHRAQILNEANAAAIKVQEALNSASLHRCVEELGRRVELEGELRRKAEAEKAEVEHRLAEVNRCLDIERRERTSLIDRFQTHIVDNDTRMKEAASKSRALLQASLTIAAHMVGRDCNNELENVSPEEDEATHGQKADAADEAGGGTKATEVTGTLNSSADDIVIAKRGVVLHHSNSCNPVGNSTAEEGLVRTVLRNARSPIERRIQCEADEGLVRTVLHNAPSPIERRIQGDSHCRSGCRRRHSTTSLPSTLTVPVSCARAQASSATVPVTLLREVHPPAYRSIRAGQPVCSQVPTSATLEGATQETMSQLLQPFFHTHVRASAPPRSRCTAPVSVTVEGTTQDATRQFLQPLFQTHARAASTPPHTGSTRTTPPQHLHLQGQGLRSSQNSPQRRSMADKLRSPSPKPGLTSPFLAQGRMPRNSACAKACAKEILETARSLSPPPTKRTHSPPTIQRNFPCSPGRNQGWPAARPPVTREYSGSNF